MRIIFAAERYIMPRWHALHADDISAKDGNDIVTIADTEAEAYLSAELSLLYPDALIIGEEAAAVDPSIIADLFVAPHAFVIDPLDGTKSFVRGHENFAVMIAELRHGSVTRSWIYLPACGDLYTLEGGEVQLNSCPLPPERAERSVPLGTKRGYKVVTAVGGLNVTHPLGSVGVAYTEILKGNLDFFVHPTTWPWDHLAGTAMITSLGGFTAVYSDVLCAAASRDIWYRVYETEGLLQ